MTELEVELASLVARLRTGSPARWARPEVAALVSSLGATLVALTAEAGDPVPDGAVLPALRPHGYGDQLTTLGHDLATVSPGPAAVATALTAVRTTRAALP